MPPAIRAENLSKRYLVTGTLERAGYRTLRDTISEAFSAPLRRLRNGAARSQTDVLWALKDVSFEVQPGEVVGVIGRNGAGKSTLLKVLSRITRPTTGRIELYGRVGSLLEVGTGFHPELTGRENIFLNGAILGMTRVEIQRQFDDIVAFAEIDRFLDTPLKRYSSGMYVRLAFAVAAHLDPEILLVDEVLSVGDAAFQKKCLQTMQHVAEDGRTIVFVSHNMEAVQRLCSRAILITAGRVAMVGPVREVVTAYLRDQYDTLPTCYEAAYPDQPALGTATAYLLHAEFLNAERRACSHLRFGEPFAIRMRWHHSTSVPPACYAIRFYDECQRFLFAFNTTHTNFPFDRPGLYAATCTCDPNILAPGQYRVSIGCYVRPHSTLHVVDPCLRLIVLDVPHNPERPFNIAGDPLVAPDAQWEFSHALPNSSEVEINHARSEPRSGPTQFESHNVRRRPHLTR